MVSIMDLAIKYGFLIRNAKKLFVEKATFTRRPL